MRAVEGSLKASRFYVTHGGAFALLLVSFLLLACGSQRRTSPAQDLTQAVHELQPTAARVVVTTTCEGDSEATEARCNELGQKLTGEGWICTSIEGGVSCRFEGKD
jgi:hypothetical protein